MDSPATASSALLEEVTRRYGGELDRFAHHLTRGDHARAQDIVQETLIRAWRHPEALDGSRGPARAWLFTVARRVAIDLARAERIRGGAAPLHDGDRPEDGVPGLDRAMEGWMVREALVQLRPEHREVLVRLHWLGQSVEEVAAALRIPGGTVKSRTFYGLRALRLALQEGGVCR